MEIQLSKVSGGLRQRRQGWGTRTGPPLPTAQLALHSVEPARRALGQLLCCSKCWIQASGSTGKGWKILVEMCRFAQRCEERSPEEVFRYRARREGYKPGASLALFWDQQGGQ